MIWILKQTRTKYQTETENKDWFGVNTINIVLYLPRSLRCRNISFGSMVLDQACTHRNHHSYALQNPLTCSNSFYFGESKLFWLQFLPGQKEVPPSATPVRRCRTYRMGGRRQAWHFRLLLGICTTMGGDYNHSLPLGCNDGKLNDQLTPRLCSWCILKNS